MRFPKFEGEWEECVLGKIASISKGAGISKDQLSKEGLPCILYGELYTTYKSEVINEILSRTNIDATNLVRSEANDVIIPSSGETAIDISTACCIPFNNILLGGDLNVIRLHNGDGSFFSYQLNGRRKYDIATIAQGVSVVHLYGDSLKRLKVYYPSNEEQHKIASLLSLIDDRIEAQIKIIEKLKSLIKELSYILLSKKVQRVKLQDCLTCHSSTLTESEVLEQEGIYPVYGATGIIAYTPQYDIYENSILIIKDGAGVGRVQYAKDKYSVTGTLNYLTSKENVSLKYIYYCLQIFNFDKYKVGSGIPHIYFKDYGNESIYCPSIEKQQEITNILSAIDEKIKIEQNMLSGYKQQKKYLLAKLFI
ncbi:putative type-1 restriction enzyme specificity protein [termite gut metagenome]|uniref:Putative type-1 restriction enzyme specificity protein n=1 Tax=termite gut metagenome TaxID=433724 RepID=A0A5J4QPQ6_9ZZZZ